MLQNFKCHEPTVFLVNRNMLDDSGHDYELNGFTARNNRG
jgi:hypothetical protein